MFPREGANFLVKWDGIYGECGIDRAEMAVPSQLPFEMVSGVGSRKSVRRACTLVPTGKYG